MAPDDDARIPSIRYEEDDEEANKATVVGAVSGRPRERAYLMVIGGDESVGRCFPVVDGMVLGRGAAADVSLSEDGVSRRHARVSRVGDDSLYFEDCGSSNGMIYRRARVSSQTVREGDRIQIGGAVLLPFFVDANGYAFEKNLFLSATEDSSTHLTHRAHFMAAAARECELAARYRVPVSFVVFAIDQHHAILQTHGASLATHLFRAVAHVARAHALAASDDPAVGGAPPDAARVRAPAGFQGRLHADPLSRQARR